MKEIVTRGCYRWGLAPTPEALDRLERFMDLLITRNQSMNLTAVTEPEEVARRHFLDSLFLLTLDDYVGRRILDVGSGAGFPAVPLLCYNPALDVTALDATAKRVEFIREACQSLGLPIATLSARAEQAAQEAEHRGQYDVVVSRAVAPLSMLAELCMPFLKVGGFFVPHKADNDEAEAEIRAARPALEALGGKLAAMVPYEIPGLAGRHQIVVIQKLGETPEQYPRRWARIKEKPLA